MNSALVVDGGPARIFVAPIRAPRVNTRLSLHFAARIDTREARAVPCIAALSPHTNGSLAPLMGREARARHGLRLIRWGGSCCGNGRKLFHVLGENTLERSVCGEGR